MLWLAETNAFSSHCFVLFLFFLILLVLLLSCVEIMLVGLFSFHLPALPIISHSLPVQQQTPSTPSFSLFSLFLPSFPSLTYMCTCAHIRTQTHTCTSCVWMWWGVRLSVFLLALTGRVLGRRPLVSRYPPDPLPL